MKIITLITCLLCTYFVYGYEFSVRDSHTGMSLNAVINVTPIELENLSSDQWWDIKLGKGFLNKELTNYNTYSNKNKFTLLTSSQLQVLKITAEGYQTLNSYIEPNQKTKLTRINLVRNSTEKMKNACNEFSVCGYVYTKKSLKPLEGASIELSNNQARYHTKSNHTGFFAIKHAMLENATLSISQTNYRTEIWNPIDLDESFQLIVDLEKGSGVNEHSMRHPLTDVKLNQIDPNWLIAKLSQDKSTPPRVNRERINGAIFLQPPASIRVGFNASGGTCCGAGCSTLQIIPFESYVQKGLDNEWIASWNTNSLKSGSIPYRSYGAWHVLHTPYTGYDICAGPCCQAYESTGYTATINAAKSTNGIMLELNGDLARSEYSAQNNSWDDPNDGLNCNNSDLSCGDGFIGSPATGWPCLSDPLTTGRGCFGHGRGMSQWGTQYHAQDNKNYALIVDHYYNDSNNPVDNRSQYSSTPVWLDSVSSSTNNVMPNQSITLNYELVNSSDVIIGFGPIILGASISNGISVYSDPTNDFSTSINQAGNLVLQRQFDIPHSLDLGNYDILASVYLDTDLDSSITGIDWKLSAFTIDNALVVNALTKLIFSNSFE